MNKPNINGCVIFTLAQKKLFARYEKSGLGKHIKSIDKDGESLVMTCKMVDGWTPREWDLTIAHPWAYIERHEALND